ncbi:MAG: hypothetical protein B7Z30_09760 [Rhizobiales bacterium 12-68-15]|nr:MAG: hypothetical protein B7Z30_09760 [Rhizobiales bacterium 12-68-15]
MANHLTRLARHLRTGLFGLGALTCLTALPAMANDYPTRPVTIIVPFAPGGPTDLIARVLGEGLQKKLGQAFVIENRPGAAGNTGMGVAARATPDGYTLLEWLKLLEKMDVTHVPYRGAGPATAAVLQGDVQYACVALPPAEPLIKAGRLNALAVTGAKRWFSLPDVPTMVELGYKDFVSDTFQALFAVAGTPKDIVTKVTTATREVMADPAVIEQANKLGFEVVNGTPDALAKRVADEIPAVRKIVSDAKISTQ